MHLSKFRSVSICEICGRIPSSQHLKSMVSLRNEKLLDRTFEGKTLCNMLSTLIYMRRNFRRNLCRAIERDARLDLAGDAA
jgi:hypothetical protein